MTLAAILYTDELLERRDVDRRQIGAESTLRDPQARAHAITLHDLSIDGCLIEASVPLAMGTMVSIGLAGVGRREASVVRTDGSKTGCRFTVPLSTDQLVNAFTKSTVVEGVFPNAIAPSELPEPIVEKWHPAVRLTLLIGLSSALWSAILHIA